MWTKWIAKKEANELQLDLLFAQDDQNPVTILLLESDTPVTRSYTGQMRQQIVAPETFTQPVNLKDVETRLYHAQGLDLGKITRNGFHLGFSYNGSCIIISSIRVFYMKCPGMTVNQTSFGGASAGSDWIRGQCVDGAEEVSTPKIKCDSNGQWGAMQEFCVCGAGHQTEGNMCKGQSIVCYFLKIYAHESSTSVIHEKCQNKLISVFLALFLHTITGSPLLFACFDSHSHSITCSYLFSHEGKYG